MTGRDAFEKEMKAMCAQHGAGVSDLAYRRFARMLRWLRVAGYGRITAHATEHRFGNKFHIKYIDTDDAE